MSVSNQVKNFCRRGIYASTRRRRLYETLWHPLIRVCNLAQRRHLWESFELPNGELERATELLGACRVLHGPFRGLKYPGLKAAGSMIFPKLIGSYERELHSVIEAAIVDDYTDIIDIGCAEGYYAVGFAAKMPGVHVWAYDTNAAALDMCREMARLNSTEMNMTFSGHCDSKTLCNLPVKGRALIFCDCEGFEESLFSEETCRALAVHDFVIEIHDFIRPFISFDLCKRLKETHEIHRVRSIADSSRPDVFQYPELQAFSPDTRISLLAELRPAEMQWFACRSRSVGHG